MRELGCDRRVISADEAVAIEPALRHTRPKLAGATYTAEDESGDANRFARELLARCISDGVHLYKLVFSRLGDRLRIAGKAERNNYDRDLNRVRCEAIVRRTEELFPGADDTEQAQFWTGLRPATPSNVPIIGRSKLPNLFVNTRHGTLGCTHARGSGKSIARFVSGLAPEVDFAFTGMPARARTVSGAQRPAEAGADH